MKYCKNYNSSLIFKKNNDFWDNLIPTTEDLEIVKQEIEINPLCFEILQATGYKAGKIKCMNSFIDINKADFHQAEGFDNHYEYLVCYYKRKMMWSKKSPFGSFLRKLDVITKIQNKLFMHAGLTLKTAARYKTIQEINNEAHRMFAKNDYFTNLFDSNGVLWTRCTYL